MSSLNLRNVLIVMAHAFVVWALCFATIGVGRAVTTMDVTLIVHAILSPIWSILASYVYFTRFNHIPPLQAALILIGFVMFLDFFVVALIILRSLEMFTSALGTWIPFALIFIASWLTGLFVNRPTSAARTA